MAFRPGHLNWVTYIQFRGLASISETKLSKLVDQRGNNTLKRSNDAIALLAQRIRIRGMYARIANSLDSDYKTPGLWFESVSELEQGCNSAYKQLLRLLMSPPATQKKTGRDGPYSSLDVSRALHRDLDSTIFFSQAKGLRMLELDEDRGSNSLAYFTGCDDFYTRLRQATDTEYGLLALYRIYTASADPVKRMDEIRGDTGDGAPVLIDCEGFSIWHVDKQSYFERHDRFSLSSIVTSEGFVEEFQCVRFENVYEQRCENV